MTVGTGRVARVESGGLLAAGVVLVVVGYAVLATRWIGADPGWYDALDKPAWQPPDWVFGVAWPYNFVALGVAGLTLALRHPGRVTAGWLLLLAVSVGFALGWAYLFYVPPHRLTAAAVSLALAAALSWLLVVVAGRTQAWTGWVLLPYAVWMTVATSLSIGFATG